MTTVLERLLMTPREQRFKTVSFDEWLPEGETIDDADVTVTELSAGGGDLDILTFIQAPDDRKVTLQATAHDVGLFKALLLVTASDGQKREIRVDYQIAEP